MSYNCPSYDFLDRQLAIEIANAVHEKNKNKLEEMYGPKVAKELRKVFRRAWRGQASSKEMFFASKRAKEALEERRAA